MSLISDADHLFMSVGHLCVLFAEVSIYCRSFTHFLIDRLGFVCVCVCVCVELYNFFINVGH